MIFALQGPVGLRDDGSKVVSSAQKTTVIILLTCSCSPLTFLTLAPLLTSEN